MRFLMPYPLVVFILLCLFSLLTGCLDSDSSGSHGEATLPPPETTATSYLEGRYLARGEQEAFIEDTHTGLIWKRCVEGQTWDPVSYSCLGTARLFNFAQAEPDERLPDANNPTIQRRTGFVLPTREQLASLLYCSNQPLTANQVGSGVCQGGVASPTILAEVFPNTPAATYWTSTCMSETCSTYYGVNFSTGQLSTHNSPQARYPLRRVRPVGN